ncbi:class E sortase [Streptomyces sp. SKN60]|uniref:class E sortase n=1 Tax=Streptomyces sp. SKN60 TaxID=2855506 RepID=UPI00224515A2|nr:class E sortase [Streptomyces sp. SKN60]MCX2179194.1 class E sortase [Streptomyces sp. SKN60]
MTAGSPWFRAANLPEEPEHGPEHGPGQAPGQLPPDGSIPGSGPVPQQGYGTETSGYETYEAYEQPYERPYEPIPGPEAYGDHGAAYGAEEALQEPQAPQQPQAPQETYYADQGAYAATPAYEPAGYAAPLAGDPVTVDVPDDDLTGRPDDSGTMALRTVEEPSQGPGPAAPGPGRAERRKAARRKGGRGGVAVAAAGPEPAATDEQARPLSRVEARRAARAAKESLGVVLSRAVGELFITFGVVMLLFVTYQLWWTNVRAGQETDQAKQDIENSFNQGDKDPGAFEPGKGFAIMYIPKLDVVVPVAEGISKTKVLDKGMVGHYGEGKLKTAMPADKQGNFAVAGHRNTHGEPFRYINQLEPGDPIVVETRDAYYTYEMASILPQTSPSNVSVIDPVPRGSGFKGPGRYITLTTCTPEFTSTYRMIVWGKLVEERPRDKGKPDALVG